jgi:hypothetical protein
MLKALLKGKLSRDQENMEDILTSNVFGVMEYLDQHSVLLAFLSQATSPEERNPFRDLSSDLKVEYKFWPWLKKSGCEGCEPDVLIRIACADDRRFVVLIEAKYWSEKSSEKGEGERLGDQLAREWENLKCLAEEDAAEGEPVLIYVTADFVCPYGDIEATQRELLEKRGEKARIWWLSWRYLPALIKDSSNEILRDFSGVLYLLGLTMFEGFAAISSASSIQWHFSASFDWTTLHEELILSWRFAQ